MCSVCNPILEEFNTLIQHCLLVSQLFAKHVFFFSILPNVLPCLLHNMF